MQKWFFAGAYATAWELQIGPLCCGVRYPSFWLYYSRRRGRKWFFGPPAFVYLDKTWREG